MLTWDMPGRVYHLSQSPLCLRAERDSVAFLFVKRDVTEENNYCEVPVPGELLPESAHTIALERRGSLVVPMTAQ